VKKILLVNPPDVDSSLFDWATAKRGRANNYPAYGLGVLARHLLNNGFEPEILNLNHELLKIVHASDVPIEYDFIWKVILADKVQKFEPDFIGVTCLFSVTGQSLVNVCKFLKSITEVPVAIGGVHVTHDVENILKETQADMAFLNESEKALIKYLKGEGLFQVIIRGETELEKHLEKVLPAEDELNVIPPFEMMDVENHSLYGTLGSWYGFRYKDTRIATALSNRGCRAHCSFCNVRSFNGVGVRQRSIESVLDELSILRDRGVGHIIWLDDDLLMREERAIALFDGMVKRKLNMTWDATNGVIAASLKRDVVAAAAASGCIGLALGIESGNEQILRSIKKPGTPRIFRRAAEVLKDFPQINVRALLIIGFPGETMGQIQDTINLCEEMNLDWHNLAILQPWKNTPIYDAMVDQGLLGEEGKLKDDTSPYQLGPYSRQRAVEQGKIQQSHYGEKKGGSGLVDFSDLNRVPKTRELDDIWFYMNVRLNFERLFRETRQVKLKQQLTWLEYVSTKTAPDNALILYFYAYLQWKVLGEIDEDLIWAIAERLDDSEYWREKFDLFGLDLKQIIYYNFPKTAFAGEQRLWQSA
jgi:radical SAM superfamily enzyme YgiQ (UPF0313 family)